MLEMHPLVAMASPTRACIGGSNSIRVYNDNDYTNIATEGNAVDFGDLTSCRGDGAGCSNGHGGL